MQLSHPQVWDVNMGAPEAVLMLRHILTSSSSRTKARLLPVTLQTHFLLLNIHILPSVQLGDPHSL